MNLTFSGKTALVTGGTSELALELARRMIETGIRPCLSYRNNKCLEKITAALDEFSGMFDTCLLDFSDFASLDPAFDCLDHGLNYLVDVAQGDFEDLVSSADSTRVAEYFSENIAFRAAMLKKATRIMIRSGSGRLVFVSSAAAGRPGKGQGFYAASKLASEALYRNTALELGKLGISAVSLRPGFINCGRGKSYFEKNRADLIKKIPSKQILTVDEVARTILFLLSDAAKGFNATELTMDFGFSAGKP